MTGSSKIQDFKSCVTRASRSSRSVSQEALGDENVLNVASLLKKIKNLYTDCAEMGAKITRF